MANRYETTIFAAGCFWGVQAYFDQVPGVVGTEVGYTCGHTKNPTYEQVCTHTTGHAECCKITFDPKKVSYQTLLKHFFRMHDPTQVNRQGADFGDQYRTEIFYFNGEQKEQAEAAIAEAQKNFSEPIATKVTMRCTFYPAEEYHQKFFVKTGYGACHVPYAPVA